MRIEDILVPIDFSPGSLRALDYALAMVDPDGEVYMMHVVDADFLARVKVLRAARIPVVCVPPGTVAGTGAETTK